MVLNDVLFYYVLVPEDSKLLLQRWFLLDGNVQFHQGRVDVFQHFEQVKGKSYVN